MILSKYYLFSILISHLIFEFPIFAQSDIPPTIVPSDIPLIAPSDELSVNFSDVPFIIPSYEPSTIPSGESSSTPNLLQVLDHPYIHPFNILCYIAKYSSIKF